MLSLFEEERGVHAKLKPVLGNFAEVCERLKCMHRGLKAHFAQKALTLVQEKVDTLKAIYPANFKDGVLPSARDVEAMTRSFKLNKNYLRVEPAIDAVYHTFGEISSLCRTVDSSVAVALGRKAGSEGNMYTVYGTVLNNTYFKKNPKDERKRLTTERLQQEARACLHAVKQLSAWPSAPGDEDPDTVLHRELRFELLQACGHTDSEAVQLVDVAYTGSTRDRTAT